jgi:hypothetical protein
MEGLLSANQNSEDRAGREQLFCVSEKSNAFALVAHGYVGLCLVYYVNRYRNIFLMLFVLSFTGD